MIATVTVKDGYISRLAVQPSSQGRGFGKLLLGVAESLARESKEIASIECYGDDVPVVEFYERNGYELVKSDVVNGATILTMQKDLTKNQGRVGILESEKTQA